MRLHPKTYRFRTDQYAFLHLPEGEQIGLLAQNLEEEFPGLVRTVRRPADVDSTGMELSPAMEFKAVKYDGLLPVVVAALKEQQSVIEAQRSMQEELLSRMDHLEQLLAACCTNPEGSFMQEQPSRDMGALLDDHANDRKLRIVPNPFNEPPTVYYTLDRAGRMQLLANSADGRELRVLEEAQREAGDYQHQWNTASLAPGMYYVTLLLDGQPVVKKAVKVVR